MKHSILIFGIFLALACGKKEREPTFVGNKETRVIHRISCSLVEKMKDENKEMFKTFKKAKGEGYKACERCDPDGKD